MNIWKVLVNIMDKVRTDKASSTCHDNIFVFSHILSFLQIFFFQRFYILK
ncbi:Uncharacterised protein [Mycobacterium tuberculosis]|uniref:Uncharacterized protein n=1 Tax=Mycobacterium tuberculosis TaxID=1773 RepID=A0A655AZ68_MYCTX|nr:Uncharacterised protein [Mycobacterium tuberculosis]